MKVLGRIFIRYLPAARNIHPTVLHPLRDEYVWMNIAPDKSCDRILFVVGVVA